MGESQTGVTYRYKDGLYLNLTNRCPTACRFCVKREWNWNFRGWDLRLGKSEPTATEAWTAILQAAETKPFRELIYCGYGECTYRLPLMSDLSRRSRRRFPGLSLRLNTIGLGNLIWGRNIVPDLKTCLDAVMISLNTASPAQWSEIHAPRARFREQGFDAVLDFIRGCVDGGLKTTITAIELPGVDLAEVRRLARRLGAGFRIRPYL